MLRVIETSRLSPASVCLFAMFVGCNGGLSALEPPELDPESAAQEAMALYDKDGDHALSKSELEACPGLAASLKVYDSDKDGMISQQEIVKRLERFVTRGIALARLSVTVTLDKKPLANATVRFVPEPYLGEEIKPASGTTRKRGSATMAVADEDLPENQKGIKGIHAGTFRVEITHPQKKIPAKYNTDTKLGYETTPGNPYASFKLKSR